MTKRATHVIGKPVVSAVSGERLGTVADLLLDDSGTTLLGLVLQQGWMKHEQVLPIASLQTIGPDTVVSRSSTVLSAREWHDQRAAADREPLDGAPGAPRP